MKHFSVLLLLISILGFSEEGMRLPSELKGTTESKMKKMGLNIPLDKIYSENQPSIKDAVVSFAGGCTGSIISNMGLVLTNHHCGYSYFQSLSSLENNILKDGFWAKNLSEEKKCEGLKINITKKILDVTGEVLQGVNEKMSEIKRKKTIEKNIELVKSKTPKKRYQQIEIKSFYKGNKYYLFVNDVYEDVRLVGCPPSSIGNFGSQTDNWVWPKHTGDFSLFRIYVDKNNEPAVYSEENKPYYPNYYIPINIGGIKENDFTMVLGYPGRTDEYLSSEGLKQIINEINPIGISIRDAAINILENKMKKDELIKIKYAAKYTKLANAWKKWKGQIEGINKTKGIEKKLEFEKQFNQLAKEKKLEKYNDYLDELNKKYNKIKIFKIEDTYYNELKNGLESFTFIDKINKIIENNDKNFNDKKLKINKLIETFFKDYDNSLDKEVFTSLMSIYREGMKKNKIKLFKELELVKDYNEFTNIVYSNSNILDKNKLLKIVDSSKNKKNLKKNLEKEKIYSLFLDISNKNKELKSKKEKLENDIDKLSRLYMEGIFVLFGEKDLYPDANSTLRVSYGKIKGFYPKDGMEYMYRTTLDGAIEKYIKDDFEFDMPEYLIFLNEKRDFREYGENEVMPLNFIATNHTSGGNSGSPVLDKNGNIIGLNFDRVWEGTMSDFNFDESVCRNIMVDIRYVLFITQRIGMAQNIMRELEIIK